MFPGRIRRPQQQSPQQQSPQQQVLQPHHLQQQHHSQQPPHHNSHHQVSPRKCPTYKSRDATPPTKKGVDAPHSPKPGSRPSSQNSSGPKRGDLRARYWAFLFDNLARAVDEIYQTCEADESTVECKVSSLVAKSWKRLLKVLISN